MKILASVLCVLLLSSCGGGNSPVSPITLAGQDVAIGAPNGALPQTDLFIKQAQQADCSADSNRLFLIDQKMVFWDRADLRCPDASYARGLYGATPDALLCKNADSIAGPQTSCSDSQNRAMFDTILSHLHSSDLGLGAGHTVEAITIQARAGSQIALESIAIDAFSSVKTARTAVVKDNAAWSALWAEHSAGRTPAPALPKVDFISQMLLAVFAGEHANGCREVGVLRAVASQDAIVVDYNDQDVAGASPCASVSSSGMQVVALARSNAAVSFVKTATAPVAFSTIDQTSHSGIQTAQTVTIRDAAGWAALWAQHSGKATAAPDIDFSKYMVLGVFSGTSSNGCYATDVRRVYSANNKLTAVHVDSVPGPAVACTLALTSPAHLVRIERSDNSVDFVQELLTVN